ncbi:serine protease [Streptomyces sp. NBC_00654]|uniref:serine protease n=1 Tax=Streptomyces sp. NBC_00654 TaxID=2975799 RepID=UPI002255560A|nr:serine protease [Streptomyces sp. NBC_00654]MCX4963584.1 serine protease [Streptomyces sp. NBC_00654]
MNSSSVSRRSALRTLAVAVALTAGAAPLWEATASAAASAAEPTTYTLTITHLDRTGARTADYATNVTGISGPGAEETVHPYDASGTTTVRLPRGRYLLDSSLTTGKEGDGTDWIVQPRLDLDRDTEVTVDARTTAPVDVRPPDRSAGFLHSAMFVRVTHDGVTRDANLINSTPDLRVAHLGPDSEPGSVRQWFDAYWSAGAADYALGYTFTGPRALTGLTRHPARRDLATLRARGAARPGTDGAASLDLQPSAGPTVGLSRRLAAPGTATSYVTPERGTWDLTYTAPGAPGARPNRYAADGIAVRAGRTTTHTFDNAVFGPDLTGRPGVVRQGDRLTVDVPLLADGDGHVPSAPSYGTARTTLHRNGVRVGSRTDAPGRAAFTVPPGNAAYRLTSTVDREGAPGTATRVTSVWTFTSGTTAGPVPVPVSAVRFSPALDPAGTAPANAALRVPVTVQGAGAGGYVSTPAVSVSVDGGTTWTRVRVERGAVTIRNPRAGKGVSLRAELTDTRGNTLTQTIIDAYRTA